MPTDNSAADARLEPTKPKAKKPRRWLRRTSLLLCGILLFGLGLGIGRGSITFAGNPSVNQNLPNKLDYSSVDELYKALKANYDGQLDVNKLTDGLKTGLVNAAGNPYTEYMNADAYKDFSNQLTGSFTGIGAELSKDANDNIIVIAPIAGFPAEKAGLKPKDLIAEIDGKTTGGMSVSDAVSKIRGPKDTQVKLKIVRDGKALDFTITRDEINIPSVDYKVENGIGYLKISRFGDDTAGLTQKAAQSFKDQNVKGVIVDLRSNPGGLLDAAVSVSSLWLPNDKTVLTERRDNVITQTFKADGTSTLQGVPTVVLIDDGSASASEITAGALKDNGAATLIGQKSFGKGSVQEIVKLRGGGVLKVTVARWFTPGGKNIDKAGISPDKEVSISAEDIKAGRDLQKDAAVNYLKSLQR